MDAHFQHIGANQLPPDGVALATQLRGNLPCPEKRHRGVPVVDSGHDGLFAPLRFLVLRCRLIVERRAGHAQQLALAPYRQLRACPDQTPGRVLPRGESSLEESPAPAQQLTLAPYRQLRACPDQTPGRVLPRGESSLEESPAPESPAPASAARWS